VVSAPLRATSLHPLDACGLEPLIGSRLTRKADLRMQRAAHPERATSTLPFACSGMPKARSACQLCPLAVAIKRSLRNRDLVATIRTCNSETHRYYNTAHKVMWTRVQHVPVRDDLPRTDALSPGRAASLRQPARLSLKNAFPKLL
jgi:hypothetical protein